MVSACETSIVRAARTPAGRNRPNHPSTGCRHLSLKLPSLFKSQLAGTSLLSTIPIADPLARQ